MALSASDVKYFDKVTLLLTEFDDGTLLISSNIDVVFLFIYSGNVNFFLCAVVACIFLCNYFILLHSRDVPKFYLGKKHKSDSH